jgi:hypothetical protein
MLAGMSCSVIRCMNPGEATLVVREEPSFISVGICDEHKSRVDAGEEWLWVHQGRAGNADFVASILMGQELLEHNEWVVDEHTGLDSFADGDECGPDGGRWVWSIQARQRGRDHSETLRLAVDLDRLREAFG